MGIRSAALAASVIGFTAFTYGASAQCKVSESELVFPSFDFEVEGGRLYATALDNGLRVIDVDDPSGPTMIGGFQPEGTIFNAAVSGQIAYVIVRTALDSRYDLFIVNMQDPAQPEVLGVFTIGDSARDVFVSGETAFVSQNNSLVSIDVSDPSSPTMLDELDGVTGYHAFAQGHTAYMTYNSRIWLVDIETPQQMEILAEVNTTGSGMSHYSDGIAVVGDYMYIGSRAIRSLWSGLDVYDVSDPASPVHIGHARTATGLYTLVVRENRAYAVTVDGEIASFDISHPVSPRFLGARPMLGSGHSLAISGDSLFASSETTLFAYNIDAGCSPCVADVNDDSSLDAKDIDHWLNAYSERFSAADQNLNGSLEPSDFTAWIANFNRGC